MAGVSKRPSLLSDDNRVAIPGLVQLDPKLARYTITPLGHVFREDGRLLTPTSAGKINFNGGRFSRALPLLVFLAFGRRKYVEAWRPERKSVVLDDENYDVWRDNCGPTDELTGRQRCTVHDVKLVPHGEVIRYGQRGILPTTQLSII